MSLVQMNFWANSLQRSTGMTIILPDECKDRFPVFYLLHGLSDDHTIWLRRTSIERYMTGIPMAVVMPNTGRGWYTNSATVPVDAYEDHIMKDVINTVDNYFHTIPSREGRVIGGLSMGGYGAMKLALKFPDMFCSATSHSGAVMTPLWKPELRPAELGPLQPEFKAIFGDWQGGPNDPIALAKKCPIAKRPALHLDCGTSDFLIEQNRAFHVELEKLNYPHEYVEHPGTHNWAYWDKHICEAISFHCKQLDIKLPEEFGTE